MPCPNGTFGLPCKDNCSCLNGGYCRRNDGACRCFPGWMGPRFTQVCLEDPNPSPDRRHFDNPVYAYQGVPPPSTSLNNTGTKHIYNDLGMKSNLNKTKLGDEDSETYACTEQEYQIGTRN
ncbi:hypothetical protein NPIL_359701 [Nephila pilipes]|uniref:Epidermal growth factor-like domain-containing protein n=1 Tax=Nephila pilipes TaxID=299642 RepID=A0A8X6NXS2_NEPPI|nr:hypothetical protein NPIL_359701 [Nephila pilipes]